jgi:hypothetical protein
MLWMNLRSPIMRLKIWRLRYMKYQILIWINFIIICLNYMTKLILKRNKNHIKIKYRVSDNYSNILTLYCNKTGQWKQNISYIVGKPSFLRFFRFRVFRTVFRRWSAFIWGTGKTPPSQIAYSWQHRSYCLVLRSLWSHYRSIFFRELTVNATNYLDMIENFALPQLQ